MRKLTEKQIDREIFEFVQWLIDMHELRKQSRETVEQNLKQTLFRFGLEADD